MRRLKAEVAEQLPAKRRQVVRLPKPRPQDWPPDGKRPRPGAPQPPASFLPASCLHLVVEKPGQDACHLRGIRCNGVRIRVAWRRGGFRSGPVRQACEQLREASRGLARGRGRGGG